MNITIRTAAAEDAHDFAYVICESWKAAYKDIITPEEMAKRTDVEKRTGFFKELILSGKEQFYLAFNENNSPCGVCSTGSARDTDMPNCGELIAIYALPEYWGKGIGKQLMDTAISGLKKQGFNGIILWTFEANNRARRFYEKCGFAFDGTYKDSGFPDTKEVRYRLE